MNSSLDRRRPGFSRYTRGRNRKGAGNDAAWAGGHAGIAGQAAVEMRAHLARGGLAFEHRLDEINAPARAVALVAEQEIQVGQVAVQAAMHDADDRIGLLNAMVLELLWCKIPFP